MADAIKQARQFEQVKVQLLEQRSSVDAVHSGIHTAMTKAVHTVVIKFTVVNAADAIVVVCTVV